LDHHRLLLRAMLSSGASTHPGVAAPFSFVEDQATSARHLQSVAMMLMLDDHLAGTSEQIGAAYMSYHRLLRRRGGRRRHCRRRFRQAAAVVVWRFFPSGLP
jgi:hypothetical protein